MLALKMQDGSKLCVESLCGDEQLLLVAKDGKIHVTDEIKEPYATIFIDDEDVNIEDSNGETFFILSDFEEFGYE